MLGHPETKRYNGRMVLESMGGGCQVAVGLIRMSAFLDFFTKRLSEVGLGLFRQGTRMN